MQIFDVTPFNINYPCWRTLDDSGFSVERDSNFCVRGIPPQVEDREGEFISPALQNGRV